MNREIITQRSIDSNKNVVKSLSQKIRNASTIDLSFLDEDFEDNPGYVSAVRKTILEDKINAQLSDQSPHAIQDVLDDDIEDNKSSMQKVKALRVQMLEEAKAKLQEQTAEKKDGYADKLVKYIPSEVIGFYTGLTAILANDTSDERIYYTYGLLFIGVIGTFLYLKSVWKISNDWQIILSCIAFLAWAVALDKTLPVDSRLQAFLLPVVTFFLPLIDPPNKGGVQT